MKVGQHVVDESICTDLRRYIFVAETPEQRTVSHLALVFVEVIRVTSQLRVYGLVTSKEGVLEGEGGVDAGKHSLTNARPHLRVVCEVEHLRGRGQAAQA